MRETTHIYRCDYNVKGEPCDMTSVPISDYYQLPDDWCTLQVKTETYHLCPNHTDILTEEVILNRKALEEASRA